MKRSAARKPSVSVAAIALLAGLLAFAPAASRAEPPGGDPRAVEHDVWEAAMERGARAVADRDLPGARRALLDAFDQGVRFSEGDWRNKRCAELLDEVARVHRERGELSALDGLLEEIGRGADRARGVGNPLSLALLRARSELASAQGRMDDLFALLTSARASIDAALGSTHPGHLTMSSLLAIAHAEAGQAERARREIDGALERARRSAGPDHPVVGELLLGRSRVEDLLGWPERGVDSARQGVAILERAAGPQNQPLAALLALAGVEIGAGRFVEAAATIDRIQLATTTATSPAQRRFAAFVDSMEALALLGRGYFSAARGAAHAARDALEKLDGPDSQGVVLPLLVEALALEAEWRQADAAEPMRRLVAVAKRIGRGSSRDGLRAQYELARLEASVVDLATGRASLERALPRAREVWGSESFVVAEGLHTLARVLVEASRPEEAAPFAQRALALAELRFGSDNPGLAPFRDTLGRVRAAEGRIDEARSLHERALSDIEMRPLPAFEAAELLGHAAETFAHAGERERAGGLERRAAELRQRANENAGGPAAPSTGSPVAPLELAEKNLRFRPPDDAAWRPWDAKSSNPAASFGLLRVDPVSFFMLTAHEIAVGTSLDTMVEFVAAGIERKGDRVTRREPHSVNGLAGTRLVVELAAPAGERFLLVTWLTVQTGFAYQLSIWAPDAVPAERVLADAERLFGGFALIDATRLAKGEARQAGDFRSPAWGYQVKLAGTSWSHWETVAGDFPHADFGAVLGDQAALVVVPIAFEGATPELELLARGFAGLLQGGSPPSPFQRTPDGRAIEFQVSAGEGAQSYRYRTRITRGERVAWGAIAWVPGILGAEADRHFEVLDRVGPSGGEPKPPAQGALEPRERLRQRLVLEGIAVACYQTGRKAEALVYLAEALRFSDPADPQLLSSLVKVQLELGRHGDVLATLEANAELMQREPILFAYRGVAREARGENAAARADYEAAFAAGLADVDLAARYVDLLSRIGAAAEALAYLERRLAEDPAPLLRRLRARLLREKGDLARAESELEALLQQAPSDLDVLYELAETRNVAGEHAAALETVDRILQVGAASSTSHFLRARAQYGLGLYKEAQASLESALALEPGAQPVRQFLDQVKAMLGEGSNFAVKQEIPPVELPADLLEELSELDVPRDAEAHGAFLYYHVTAVRWAPGEEIRSTARWKARILDRRGLEGFASLKLAFDPLGEELYVNELVVRDAEGKEVSRGRVDDFYVVDATQPDVASSRKLLNLPVRGLEPGMTVELVATRRERGAERFRFVDHLFSRELPVARSLFSVEGAVAELAFQASEGAESRRSDDRLQWSMDEPPPYKYEPMQPFASTYLPTLRIADRRDSWEKVARDYLAELADRLASRSELAPIVAEQTSGLASADEKARALAGWVQRQLSYRAIAFGTRARMPYPVPEILDRRYGDCKDHALLLHHLLAGAGLRSQLVLVNGVADVDPRLASLDQFDHVIVHCADCSAQRYFDATDKGFALGSDVPRGAAGKQVLVLDPEAPRFEQLPAAQDGPHAAVSTRSVEVAESGAVSVEEQLRLSGYPAAMMRDLLRAYEKPLWKEVVARTLGSAGVEIRELEVKAVDEPDRPLELVLEYGIDGAFSRSSSGLVGRIPTLFESALLRIDRSGERTSPFEIQIPLRFETHARLRPPSGFEIGGKQKAEGDREGSFASWSGAVARDGESLELSFRFGRRAGRFAPRELDDYYADVQGALDFLGHPVELGSGGRR